MYLFPEIRFLISTELIFVAYTLEKGWSNISTMTSIWSGSTYIWSHLHSADAL